MNPEDIIAAATAYAAQWAEQHKDRYEVPFGKLGTYDEGPVCRLEALLEDACACGCGKARVYYATATLRLPHEYEPYQVPEELVKYVAALVEQYRAVSQKKEGA